MGISAGVGFVVSITSVAVVDPPELRAVILYIPKGLAEFGVPEMIPRVAFKINPGGRLGSAE